MLFEESDEEPELGIRNGNVNCCLSSLVETTLARPHLSQPGQCGHKKTIYYTMSWDEESCTLKQNLASKIEIWNHFIFKCNVNSPQTRLTNFIYEPNTLPGVYYISQCDYYPHSFQKQHCYYQLLAKAVLDAFEYLLHTLYGLMSHQNGKPSSTDSIIIQNSCLCKTLKSSSVSLNSSSIFSTCMVKSNRYEKCLQNTVAVSLNKISSCWDETATNGAIYLLQKILGITFLQLWVVHMQGAGVTRILMHQI